MTLESSQISEIELAEHIFDVVVSESHLCGSVPQLLHNLS